MHGAMLPCLCTTAVRQLFVLMLVTLGQALTDRREGTADANLLFVPFGDLYCLSYHYRHSCELRGA